MLCHPGTKSSTDLPDCGTPTLGLRPRVTERFGVAILGLSCEGFRSCPATSRLFERANSDAISSVIPIDFDFFLIGGPVRQDSLPLSTLAPRASGGRGVTLPEAVPPGLKSVRVGVLQSAESILARRLLLRLRLKLLRNGKRPGLPSSAGDSVASCMWVWAFRPRLTLRFRAKGFLRAITALGTGTFTSDSREPSSHMLRASEVVEALRLASKSEGEA